MVALPNLMLPSSSVKALASRHSANFQVADVGMLQLSRPISFLTRRERGNSWSFSLHPISRRDGMSVMAAAAVATAPKGFGIPVKTLKQQQQLQLQSACKCDSGKAYKVDGSKKMRSRQSQTACMHGAAVRGAVPYSGRLGDHYTCHSASC